MLALLLLALLLFLTSLLSSYFLDEPLFLSLLTSQLFLQPNQLL